MDSLRTGANNATGLIDNYFGQARGDLTSYGGQAQGLLSGGVNQAVGTVQGSNANYQPYAASGGAASGMLSNALGLNGPAGNDAARAAFQAAPGYAWNVDQATDAAARKAAALGMAGSGNTLDAIARLGSNLANQEYGGWLDRLTGVGNHGLTAAAGMSDNNRSAAGYQYGGGSTGAQLALSLGTNLGNLGMQQGSQLAGIQSNLGSSLAGVQQQSGQQRAQNITNAALGQANLGMQAGQAQDSADNTNAGMLSKLLGSITGLPFGGLTSGSGGSFSVTPGSNGSVSITPSGGSGGGLLSSALGKFGSTVGGYL